MDQLQEQMWTRRSRMNKSRWKLCGGLWLIFGILCVVSLFVFIPPLAVGVLLMLAIFGFLYAALAMQACPTRATVVYDLRRRVAWGMWAADELKAMGEDPFVQA